MAYKYIMFTEESRLDKINRPIEQVPYGAICNEWSGLFGTAYFCRHEEEILVIGPDDVWITILNNFVRFCKFSVDTAALPPRNFPFVKTDHIPPTQISINSETEDVGTVIKEETLKKLRGCGMDEKFISLIMGDFTTTTETHRLAKAVSVLTPFKLCKLRQHNEECYEEFCKNSTLPSMERMRYLPGVKMLGSSSDWEKLEMMVMELQSLYSDMPVPLLISSNWWDEMHTICSNLRWSYDGNEHQDTKEWWSSDWLSTLLEYSDEGIFYIQLPFLVDVTAAKDTYYVLNLWSKSSDVVGGELGVDYLWELKDAENRIKKHSGSLRRELLSLKDKESKEILTIATANKLRQGLKTKYSADELANIWDSDMSVMERSVFGPNTDTMDTNERFTKIKALWRWGMANEGNEAKIKEIFDAAKPKRPFCILRIDASERDDLVDQQDKLLCLTCKRCLAKKAIRVRKLSERLICLSAEPGITSPVLQLLKLAKTNEPPNVFIFPPPSHNEYDYEEEDVETDCSERNVETTEKRKLNTIIEEAEDTVPVRKSMRIALKQKRVSVKRSKSIVHRMYATSVSEGTTSSYENMNTYEILEQEQKLKVLEREAPELFKMYTKSVQQNLDCKEAKDYYVGLCKIREETRAKDLHNIW